MNFDFDRKIDRRGTKSAKWDMVDESVIPMWVADMDFQSPIEVTEALRKKVDHGVYGYPCDDGEGQKAVANWVYERHGWEVDPEEVVLLQGVVNSFNLVSKVFAFASDNVLLQSPAYEHFYEVAENVGLGERDFKMTLDEDGQYSLNIDSFEAALTEETKVFLFCNPHNPTGRVFKKKELEALAEVCLRHDVLICSDEIHSDLVYSGHKHVPIASLSKEISKKTITLLAPSKTFNLAGLKASVAIIQDKELREKFIAKTQGFSDWVNSFGQTALVAAYNSGGPWLDALLFYLEANRDYAYEFINTQLPNIQMAKPEGTYLAWLDCRDSGIEGNPADFFREKAKVELNTGEKYGALGEGFVRLNFACPRQQLEEALLRMKKAILIN